MLNEIVSLLRFITDPETRKTVQSLASIPSRNKLDWKRDVKTASAKFSGIETFKVAGFANAVLEDMKAQQISETEIKKFKSVFDELVRNAFEHGCKESKNCKVSINCTYSRWFAVLEVSDTGKGFDFPNALVQKDDETHGLHLVNKLAYRFTANKKGNLLTALLIPEPVLEILPRVEKYDGKEILIITVADLHDWRYMIADWEPLQDAVKFATQGLILIDCSHVNWGTKEIRTMKELVKEFKEYSDRFFALVISKDINDYFDFSRLSAGNLRVFVAYEWSHPDLHEGIVAAKKWLSEQVHQRTSRQTKGKARA